MKYRTWKFAISKCIAWQGTEYDSSFNNFVYEDRGMQNNKKKKTIPKFLKIEFKLTVNLCFPH